MKENNRTPEITLNLIDSLGYRRNPGSALIRNNDKNILGNFHYAGKEGCNY